MKKSVLISASIQFLLLVQAQASGCGGGDWETTATESLPPAEIRTNYYGDPVTEVYVWPSTLASVTIRNVGTKENKLTFLSDSFSFETIDLGNLLLSFRKMGASIRAETGKVCELNHQYDDCQDIPANTLRTTITYKFSVPTENGQFLEFRASSVSYKPPLNF